MCKIKHFQGGQARYIIYNTAVFNKYIKIKKIIPSEDKLETVKICHYGFTLGHLH